MTTTRLAVALLLALLAGATGMSLAQPTQDPDRFFGLEWTGGERRGHPNVNGYVVNNYRLRAANMRLLVDGLDGGGKVLETASGVVADVPAGARVYFEVPVKHKAARYRVRIESWDWREAGQ